jgi:hypothetical protein
MRSRRSLPLASAVHKRTPLTSPATDDNAAASQSWSLPPPPKSFSDTYGKHEDPPRHRHYDGDAKHQRGERCDEPLCGPCLRRAKANESNAAAKPVAVVLFFCLKLGIGG